MLARGSTTGRRQQGVALAYVLWMLAGLTLLVGSVITISVGDVRATGRQLDEARTRAAGVGAAHLLLKAMEGARASGDYDGRSVFLRSFSLGDYRLTGRVIPLAGLVALNAAPVEQLSPLFRHAGGLAAGPAERLAAAVVRWREDALQRAGGRGSLPFRVIEDLLRVPGMSRTVYDRVRRLVHAEAGAGGKLDPLAAPRGNLLALAGGDVARVDDFMAAREAGDAPRSLPQLSANGGRGGGTSRIYCVEIDVQLPDGDVLQQRLWVDLGASRGSLPWRIERVEPVEAPGAGGVE